MELTKSSYIVPYPQEALEGEIGLTAEELSKAPGVSGSHVRAKISRSTAKNVGIFTTSRLRCINKVNKTGWTEFVVNVPFAKYLVATWKNDMGIGYFQYLLRCEEKSEKAEKLIPALFEEIKKLKNKRVSKKNSTIKVYNPHLREDIFGKHDVYYTSERVPRDKATDTQIKQSRLRRMVNIGEGISKAIKEMFVEEQDDKERLLLIKSNDKPNNKLLH